jgi:hypothetical protein
MDAVFARDMFVRLSAKEAGRVLCYRGATVLQDAAGPRAGLSPPEYTSSHTDRFV